MGAEPRDREQYSGKDRDQRAGPGSARIEDVADAEEERHKDRRSDWSDGFDQPAVRVAAKRDLFGKSGDGEGKEIEKKQAEGARLRPELDVQCSGDSHGYDSEHDKAPAKRRTEHPLPWCR